MFLVNKNNVGHKHTEVYTFHINVRLGQRRFDMHLKLPKETKSMKQSGGARVNISPDALSSNPLVRQLMQTTLGENCEQVNGCPV
jgi:hypothetical protein